MFDLTSGKLLLLGIVALIVLGPKDFPILLRTIGKYMGIIKRQADEVRDQFNEAMRESELEQIKKEVEGLGREAETSLKETGQSITKDFDTARADIESHLEDPLKPSAHTDSYTPIDLREPSPTNGADTPTPDRHAISDLSTPSEAPQEMPEPAHEPPARTALNGSGHHTDMTPAGEASPKTGT
jgi:sec-independent protein translocase protein TatB